MGGESYEGGMGKGRLRQRFRVLENVWWRSLPVLGASGSKQWRDTGKLRFMLANRLLRPENASAQGVDLTFRLSMPPKMGRTRPDVEGKERDSGATQDHPGTQPL